jgi:hypothetical protein
VLVVREAQDRQISAKVPPSRFHNRTEAECATRNIGTSSAKSVCSIILGEMCKNGVCFSRLQSQVRLAWRLKQ